MIKSFLSDSFGRLLLMSLLLVVTISVLLGFIMDIRGFSGNILAEVAGSGIAILIGLLVIDKFVEYRREQQWAKARRLTYEALSSHICDIASDVYMYFPIKDHRSMGTILEGRNTPSQSTHFGFEDLLQQLKKLPASISGEKSTSDVAVEFYEAVIWDLDQIQNVLTPRIIQSSNDQELIDALVEFDNGRRQLHNSIIGHKLAATHNVFPNLLILIERSGRLYQTLYSRWSGHWSLR